MLFLIFIGAINLIALML